MGATTVLESMKKYDKTVSESDQLPLLVAHLVFALQKQQHDIDELRSQLTSLRNDMTSSRKSDGGPHPTSHAHTPSSPPSVVHHSEYCDIPRIEDISTPTDRLEDETKQQSCVPVSEMEGQLCDPISPLRTTTETPKAKEQQSKTAQVHLAPHSAAMLTRHQRTDAVLRHFMRTKEGLFGIESMTIPDIDDCSIFCFHKKAYIPTALRAKTIQYYKTAHQDSEERALNTLKSNCIWPEMEHDFYGFDKDLVVAKISERIETRASTQQASPAQREAENPTIRRVCV